MILNKRTFSILTTVYHRNSLSGLMFIYFLRSLMCLFFIQSRNWFLPSSHPFTAYEWLQIVVSLGVNDLKIPCTEPTLGDEWIRQLLSPSLNGLLGLVGNGNNSACISSSCICVKTMTLLKDFCGLYLIELAPGWVHGSNSCSWGSPPF
jgi:hypothetical protein